MLRCNTPPYIGGVATLHANIALLKLKNGFRGVKNVAKKCCNATLHNITGIKPKVQW